MSPSQAGRRPLRPWLVAVCAVASLQILLGLAGLAAAAAGAEWCRPTAVLDWQRAVVAGVFGALAWHLLLGSRGDQRAENLGALFLLVAVFYTHPAIEALSDLMPPAWTRLPRAVASLSIAALTPTLAWLLYRDFPRALEWPKSARFASTMIVLSCATAGVLIAANLAIGARPELGVVRAGCGAGASTALGPLAFLDPADRGGFYWTAVFGLMLPGLPFMAWRMRHAPSDERRRVRIFVLGGMLAALPPICLAVLPSLSSTVEDFVRSEWAGSVLIPLNLLMILTMAAITAYSVVVQQVLPVRTLLRTAAQYWLARIVVGVVVAVPFALLLAILYESRGEPLGDVLSGERLARVTLLAVLGGAAVLLSRRAVPFVDRLFFREGHDAREILAVVAERSAAAGSISALAESLAEDVDRALHLESAGVLIGAGDAFVPVAGTLRALPRASRLATRVCESREPLAVGLGRRAALESLTEEDRIWLADAGAQLLVPLLGSDGATPGILVLGPKRSELPFSRDDILLLGALASAVGSTLENRMLRESAPAQRVRATEEEAATECETCGRIQTGDATRCAECDGALRRAPLPPEPFGKFRLERRVGAGAMGVVYRAEDLTLGRTVVLKTLPETSPEDSVRLRHEARAMAAITHPNLAVIHGAETWQGTPILVIEYLAGGTLDERLREGPLGLLAGLELAAVMARVLETAHGAGILHRDVKPSNIGFTDDDEPKLLDFGLARIAGEAAEHNGVAHPGLEEEFGGTLAYMSPEALRGRRPEPGFDLWGLSVVAFEAACGRHPFAAPTSGATLVAIGGGWNDAVAARLPECPDALTKFFARSLARERGRRPASAGELAQELQLAAAAVC